MAGLVAAASVAHYSNQRARVLVVDRNPASEPGKKTHNGWTCGDAVSRNSLNYLAEKLGIHYGRPEVEHDVKGIYVYSPDHKTKVLFEGEGHLLNRKLAPRRQVKDAEKLGVEFRWGVTAERLLAEDGYIAGVTGRDGEGDSFRATAKVVIDATGSSSVLRRFLPIESYIEREIDMDDIEATGRYILEFDRGAEDETYFTPEYCLIHLDQYLAPAGYCVAPDTPVVCKNSLKAVQEVKLGDEVLTSVGWMPVSNTSVRKFAGELVVITPCMINQAIKLTPEHLVRVWNPRTGERWKRADELVRNVQGKRGNGDYLVMPLPIEAKVPLDELDVLEHVTGNVENGYVHVTIKRSFFNGRARDGSYRRKTVLAKHPKDTKLPVKIALDPDFMELCGWYVSEGCIKKNHVVISNTDPQLISRIRELAVRRAGNVVVWKHAKNDRTKTVQNVEITNSLVARLMQDCFGRGARNKKLPSWIHGISRDSKTAFLRGFLLGDGSIERSRGGRSDARTFTTTSRALVVDLWILLAGIGVISAIKRNKKKDAWAVGVFGHQANFLGEDSKTTGRKQHRGFFLGDGRVYLGIRKLERASYSGPVYDINSAGDFTPLFTVHNCWVFPKGQNKVNIGLGVSKSGLDRRNRRFNKQDNLQSLIDTYVRENPVIKNPRLASGEDDEDNAKGNWQVPVRRQNDCMVANGFAVVGDAAWLPRPLDAGGIGPSIYAGVILGKVVAAALEAKETGQESLWGYNVEYMKTHGFQMASFEVLRRYLQTLTNEQINYGMKHFLSEEDIQAITDRKHPDFNRTQFFNPAMWFRVLGDLNLARGLRYTAKKSQTLVTHNLEYPESPGRFGAWRDRLRAELRETVEKFKPLDALQ